MIGEGKWQVTVKSLVFTGEIGVEIREENGEPKINFEFPEKYREKGLKLRTYDITVDGNTIRGKGEISMLKGKELGAEVSFDGDKMEGFLDIPFLKKQIPLRNGHKVSD